MNWLQKLFHKHEWKDQFEFASCCKFNIETGKCEVVAKAIMMKCKTCDHWQRRPL